MTFPIPPNAEGRRDRRILNASLAARQRNQASWSPARTAPVHTAAPLLDGVLHLTKASAVKSVAAKLTGVATVTGALSACTS